MRVLTAIFLVCLFFDAPIIGQTINNNQPEDESSLYASTKQVNQFIRRFNGEEDLYGKRLYPKDKKYRDNSLRKRYLPDLFDNENNELKSLQKEFVSAVNSNNDPQYFDFYGGQWFAEVAAKFLFYGKEQDVVMYFKIEKETGGYKWSYANVYASFFDQQFKTSPPTETKFIHPMSHEIDFMSLRKVFKNYMKIEHYAEKDYSPDFLSLFFYEVKRGNLVFQSVSDVKFHIFQVKDWYFEMQYFNRKGDNTGWLISNLIKIPEKDKASLIKTINHEN